MINYTVFTDGAYSFAREQGGCAFVILNAEGKEVAEYSKCFVNCTNNQMEMMACIIALESIKTPSEILIMSDSMYVIGTYTKNWRRKKNQKLWERFDKAIAFHKKVDFQHVKGHEDNLYNNRCDQLAVEATKICLTK